MVGTLYRGSWRSAPNLSADAAGSIHDDRQARRLGFAAALVGGSVLCAFIEPRLVEQFGRAWYERGFIQQSFLRPVYTSDEFRVTLDDLSPGPADEALFAVGLEKRDGERATAGFAGLALPDQPPLAPWQRPDQPHAATSAVDGPAADPLPEEPIGTRYPARTVSFSPEDSAGRRSAARDDLAWYVQRSPWGEPIVPSFMLLLQAAQSGRGPGSFRIRAGMNAVFQLLNRGPLFCGRPYEIQTTLVAKGFSGRTAFRTTELALVDVDGNQPAILRQKIRWFPASSAAE
ncbi:MAG TPA: hypothetical protein VH916_07180 [Dehalococcoidia bacterium]|jgi:hypothetical protein